MNSGKDMTADDKGVRSKWSQTWLSGGWEMANIGGANWMNPAKLVSPPCVWRIYSVALLIQDRTNVWHEKYYATTDYLQYCG